LCNTAQHWIDEVEWWSLDLQVDAGAERQAGVGASQPPDGAGPSGIAGDHNAIIPYVPPVERGEPLSQFEQFEQIVLGRLDTMAKDQREHYEICAARF